MTGLMFVLRLLVLALLGWVLWRTLRRWLTRHTTPTPPAGDTLTRCPVCADYVTTSAPRCARPGCPRLAVLLFLLLFGWVGAAQAESGGRYTAYFKAENATVILRVNGIPAAHWSAQGPAEFGTSFNHWLRTGVNSVAVEISPVAGKNVPRVSGQVSFTALATGQVSHLIELTDPQKTPARTAMNFQLGSAPELKLWRSQPLPSPLPSLEAGPYALLQELREQLLAQVKTGQDPLASPLLSAEIIDLALAYGAPAAKSQLVKSSTNRDTIRVSALPIASDLVFTALPGGMLARLARSDGRPLIVLRGQNLYFAVKSLVMGWVDGRWTILRRAE